MADHEKKETVGKIALDLQKKTGENRDPIAQREAMLSDYEDHFNQAFERGLSQFQGDFYIVVLTKRERLLRNIIRHFWVVRESCPTPSYDQTVYHCVRSDQRIDLLWTVPNIETCDRMKTYPALEQEDRKELLKCVLDFEDGTLLQLAQQLNGEIIETKESKSFDPKKLDQENLVTQA